MKNIRPLIVLIAIVIGITTSAQSQNVGINSTGDTPNSSAMLDVSAANKGLLIPNVSLTGTSDGTTIAAPATSLLVYNTSTVSDVTPGYYYNSGTTTTPVWKQLATASSGWTNAGNEGTVDGTHYIGTTDDVPFNIRVNNQKAGRITSTSGQVFLGYQAGNNNTGYNNTGIGREALFSNTTGTGNTANGRSALYSNTIGFENTAIGLSTLHSNTEGNFNTATGSNALYSNTTGSENTSTGRWALKSNTTGDYNTANGGFALTSNTEGNNNTAAGNRALYSNTTGDYNTANGRSALSSNTTGNNNTATGFRALTSNTTGDYNTANGYKALYSNTSGNFNTAIGPYALYNNTTGYNNSATGFRALTSNNTGSDNTAIGFNSDVGSNNLVNATAIGANAIVNQSNSLVLGNNVNVGIGTSSPSEMLDVNGNVKVAGIISGVSDPISAQDAATKAYVDGEISSFLTISTYTVGDFAQGGIVFWVDETGKHGLVCAKSDQNSGIRWYAGVYGNTQAKGDGTYSGEANTAIIIAAQVAIGDDGGTYAARICNELQITEGGTTYGDWYLPSKYELDLMYDNKATIDATALANGGVGFAADWYWSSAEYNGSIAWAQNFGNGYLINYNKGTDSNVRAVRAF